MLSRISYIAYSAQPSLAAQSTSDGPRPLASGDPRRPETASTVHVPRRLSPTSQAGHGWLGAELHTKRALLALQSQLLPENAKLSLICPLWGSMVGHLHDGQVNKSESTIHAQYMHNMSACLAHWLSHTPAMNLLAVPSEGSSLWMQARQKYALRHLLRHSMCSCLRLLCDSALVKAMRMQQGATST